jgi:Leucine-rich repeat (LRR) protein
MNLSIFNNQLTSLPERIGQLSNLASLYVHDNQLTSLPDSLGQLTNLETLDVARNQVTDLPASLAWLEKLTHIDLKGNPLNPALESAYQGGLDSLRAYLLKPARAGQARSPV